MHLSARSIAFLTFLCISPFAWAEQAGEGVLFIDPHRLVIKPDEKAGTLSVSNRSDKPHRYKLILVDQVMDEKGATHRRDTFMYSAKKMVKFAPKSFVIQPEEEQTVRVAADRPAGLADGDYHSHLLFSEIPLDSIEAAASAVKKNFYGIAVPLVIQQGTLNGTVTFDKATADVHKHEMTVDVTRIGNTEVNVVFSAEYMPAGKPPVTVLEPQWISIYREADTVSHNFVLTHLPDEIKGGKLVIYLDKNDGGKPLKKEIPLP